MQRSQYVLVLLISIVFSVFSKSVPAFAGTGAYAERKINCAGLFDHEYREEEGPILYDLDHYEPYGIPPVAEEKSYYEEMAVNVEGFFYALFQYAAAKNDPTFVAKLADKAALEKAYVELFISRLNSEKEGVKKISTFAEIDASRFPEVRNARNVANFSELLPAILKDFDLSFDEIQMPMLYSIQVAQKKAAQRLQKANQLRKLREAKKQNSTSDATPLKTVKSRGSAAPAVPAVVSQLEVTRKILPITTEAESISSINSALGEYFVINKDKTLSLYKMPTFGSLSRVDATVEGTANARLVSDLRGDKLAYAIDSKIYVVSLLSGKTIETIEAHGFGHGISGLRLDEGAKALSITGANGRFIIYDLNKDVEKRFDPAERKLDNIGSPYKIAGFFKTRKDYSSRVIVHNLGMIAFVDRNLEIGFTPHTFDTFMGVVTADQFQAQAISNVFVDQSKRLVYVLTTSQGQTSVFKVSIDAPKYAEHFPDYLARVQVSIPAGMETLGILKSEYFVSAGTIEGKEGFYLHLAKIGGQGSFLYRLPDSIERPRILQMSESGEIVYEEVSRITGKVALFKVSLDVKQKPAGSTVAEPTPPKEGAAQSESAPASESDS